VFLKIIFFKKIIFLVLMNSKKRLKNGKFSLKKSSVLPVLKSKEMRILKFLNVSDIDMLSIIGENLKSEF